MDSTVRSGGVADLPRPGDFICGKYRIDSVVGTGGMGIVMGAYDTSLGRPVAIKFLSPSRATREGAIQRFLREARAAASIQSEHVVRVFEVSTLPDGTPFIVMEYLRGFDLAQLLTQRGALSIEEACDYVLQSCEALGEAHGRGIVHRDLKPQNLFLSQRPDGSPCMKVLDFGISKAMDDVAQNLTSTDTVMGTPLYMSPEQVRSLKNVDARADIWALGSILFELLTMSPIYQAPSASALCAMIAMDPPTPLRARRPQAPPELEAVILRCLHKDPMGRFQDVAALGEALAPFASDRGRLSATRISRVVRGGHAGSVMPGTGPGPGPHGSDPYAIANASFPPSPMNMPGAQFATTATSGANAREEARGSYAPSLMPMQPGLLQQGPGPSNYPPGGGHPTTQSTWQHTGTGGTGERRGKSGVLVAVLGVLTGLVLLAIVGSGGYWYLIHRDASATVPTAVNDAGAPAVIPSAASAITTTASAKTAPTTTATASKTGPSNVKDAGAPSSKKDGGAAPLPGPPQPPRDEELEGKRKMHTAFCDHNQMQLSQPNPPTSVVQSIKTQSCLPGNGPDGARCERDLCRQACIMLKDQQCIQQIDYANRSYPPKY
jgi:eukaryotic-like serine/threonine-protein kinase